MQHEMQHEFHPPSMTLGGIFVSLRIQQGFPGLPVTQTLYFPEAVLKPEFFELNAQFIVFFLSIMRFFDAKCTIFLLFFFQYNHCFFCKNTYNRKCISVSVI